ncbi:hypothetical protein H9P43_005899 [Blastocladiella emersonii ATCC 22665]|nr:hypothetical protein H9P43_005899 [Blastocladiella emersonii ATCC 22665]
MTQRSDGSAAAAGYHPPAYDLADLFGDAARCTANYFTATDLEATHGQHMASGARDVQLLVESKYVPLPRDLVNELAKLECRCFMGLLPALRRAWVSVDGRLYLWDYERNDYLLIKTLPHVITAVGLVKPAKDVFVDDIKYLLVVATAGHVYLDCVKIKKAGGSNGTAATGCPVFTDAGISVAADGASFRTIHGSRDGRIFMGGIDGHVYELLYQGSSSVWSALPTLLGGSGGRRKLQKVNHTKPLLANFAPSFAYQLAQLVSSTISEDPIRDMAVHDEYSLLFTLHDSQKIYVRSMSFSGKHTAVADKLLEHAASVCVQSPLTDPARMRIVSLHPVAAAESARIHLVAVTNTALRLYLSVEVDPADKSPKRLDLQYVRLPPNRDIPQSFGQAARHAISSPMAAGGVLGGTSGAAAVGNDRQPIAVRDWTTPPNVHIAHYARGLLLAVHAGAGTTDTVLAASTEAALLPRQVAHQSGGARTFPAERAHLLHLDGRTLDMAEVDPATASVVTAETPRDEDEAPRHVLVLSGEGLRVLAKHRPLDELAHLARADARDVSKFAAVYGANTTCAWLLAMACGNTGFVHPTLRSANGASSAAAAPTAPSANGMTTGNSSVFGPTPAGTSHAFAATVRRLFFQTGGAPVQKPAPAAQSDLGRTLAPMQTEPSACARGLDLYLHRLSAPLTKRTVLTQGVHRHYELGIKDADLARAEAELARLRAFLDDWPQAQEIAAVAAAAASASTGKAGAALAPPVMPANDAGWAKEREYLAKRFDEVKLSLEAVRFVRLLASLRLPELVHRLPATERVKDVIAGLSATPFEQLTSPAGRAFCGSVATCLVQTAGQLFPTEGLAARLEADCPALLSVDTIYSTSVLEKLQQYEHSTGMTPEDLAGNVDHPRVAVLNEALAKALEVAGKLHADQFDTIAAKFTEINFARAVLELALRRAAELDPADDAAGFVADGMPEGDPRAALFVARAACYDRVLAAFDDLNDRIAQYGDTAPVRAALDSGRARVHERALQAPDRQWHAALYAWYAERDAQALLQLRTPYLEAWLAAPASARKMHLLAQYYENKRRFDDAARTLLALATSTADERDAGAAPPMSLDDRVHTLLHALQAAKATTDMELQAQVQDLLDVAHVQRYLIEQLAASGDAGAAAAVAVLSRELATMQDLYNVARAQNLARVQFRILAVSTATNADVRALQDLWAAALDASPVSDVSTAQIAFETLLGMGGPVRPATSGDSATGADAPSSSSAIAAAILQATGASTGSLLFAPDAWLAPVVALTKRHAFLARRPAWWVAVAERAAVIDLAAVGLALHREIAEQPIGGRDLLPLVAAHVATLAAWHRVPGAVAGQWRAFTAQLDAAISASRRVNGEGADGVKAQLRALVEAERGAAAAAAV